MTSPSCLPQHLDYSNLTRNIDSTLSLFCQDRNRIIEDLSKDPINLAKRMWTSESPISIDRECMCQMGRPFPKTIKERVEARPDLNLIMRRMYRCAGCNIMRRLYDIEKIEPGCSFKIECGRYRDKVFVVESMPISILSMNISSAPSKYLDLIQHESNMKKCEPGIFSLKKASFMGSDPYTNRLLVTWYADYILSLKGLPHINRIHTAFVCQNEGYMLNETPDIGNLEAFSSYTPFSRVIQKPSVESTSYLRMMDEPVIVMTSDTIIHILKELLSTLRLLHKYDFSYGGVDSDSLVFYAERSAYHYDGINVNCDFTLKLNDLRNCGITVKSESPNGNQRFQLRLYHLSELAESQIEAVPFIPMISTVSLKDASASQISSQSGAEYYVYTIGGKGGMGGNMNKSKFDMLFSYMQHLGIPLYQSSFDIYSFMILLMSNRAFYGGVSEDATLFDIWKSMWVPSEFNDINISMRDFHEYETISKLDIIKFLSKYRLRCDINNKLWQSLQYLS
jgi:hypothetical protein